VDTIWTGAVAGAAAAVVTLATQFLTQRHQMHLLNRELEHQTRAALRKTYDKLLVAQRQSREASLRAAAQSSGTDVSAGADKLKAEATAAHNAFIEQYHLLNLDASREMWLDARSLRDVLDDMLKAAQGGDTEAAEQLFELARDARQNLERSFRARLGHEVLQARRDLPAPYEKATSGKV